MKLQIDRFTVAIIKENIIYFTTSLAFTLILIFFIPAQISEYNTLKLKSNEIDSDILKLEKKQAVIYSFNANEIKELVATLNTLLPQTEDFFSIFQALDNLSLQTGFTIISYTVAPSPVTSGKLSLTIGASGSPDSFLKFLENYQFKSGRLITMDSIQFIPSTSQSSLAVNFFSREIKVADSDIIPKIDPKLIEKIKNLNLELKSSLRAPERPKIDTNYSPKSNPFEL